MNAEMFIKDQQKLKMTDREFQQFREIVYTQTHIYCADTQRPLFERKIRIRLSALKMSSFQEYYRALTSSYDGKKEFTELINIIAVHETSFFRIRGHFTALTEYLFPDLMQQSGHSPLYIWSAGCSTGEEPFSIVITFLEFLARRQHSFSLRAIDILATDLSPLVIQKAQQGRYSAKQVEKIPQPFLDKYFARHDSQYYLISEVKKPVRFEVANLIHLNAFPKRYFHIIFCRNVLIYFDRRAQAMLVHALVEGLIKGGYLFLGDAESIHVFPEVTKKLNMLHLGNAIVYQKYVG